MTATKFAPAKTCKDSGRISINVDRNGRPFGQLWTYRNTAEEFHPWHAKTLAGAYQVFQPATLSANAKKIAGFDAMAWINAQ